jgi:hypothetical protein
MFAAESVVFPYEFQNTIGDICKNKQRNKKTLLGFDWGSFESTDQFGRNSHLNYTESSNSLTCCIFPFVEAFGFSQ